MKLVVKKTDPLKGVIKIPGSKSHSIRALVIALLSKGATKIKNFLISDDTNAAKNICCALGVNISICHDSVIAESLGIPLNIASNRINSGNSGITTSFILPILGLSNNPQKTIVLDCDDQMRNRPIKPLLIALQNLGMQITSLHKDEKLPIQVNGSLLGGNTEVDGSNSQYLSALLFALPCAPNNSEIYVKNLQERPYVEMSLKYLDSHKIHYKHIRDKEWDIYQILGNQQYQSVTIQIPGDYSSASYAITAACILKSNIIIQGLDLNDPQGDKRLIDILKQMGVDITVKSTGLIIKGGKSLIGTNIDANDIPDLLPVLAVLGVYAKGKTKITNVAHARIKETDRINSMVQGLMQLGAKIKEESDGLTIWQSQLKGCEVSGCNDHRTVMALSVAGLIANGTTMIDTAESINKTYPSYVESMKQLGADMRLSNEL